MGNPILIVESAGYGETPDCPEARFGPGDTVAVAEVPGIPELPKIGVIAAVVPPGFPPQYAMADAAGKPRPLTISPPRAELSYIVGFEGDTRPYQIPEECLSPTNQAAAVVTWQSGPMDGGA